MGFMIDDIFSLWQVVLKIRKYYVTRYRNIFLDSSTRVVSSWKMKNKETMFSAIQFDEKKLLSKFELFNNFLRYYFQF